VSHPLRQLGQGLVQVALVAGNPEPELLGFCLELPVLAGQAYLPVYQVSKGKGEVAFAGGKPGYSCQLGVRGPQLLIKSKPLPRGQPYQALDREAVAAEPEPAARI
jgi:hypothetical protein